MAKNRMFAHGSPLSVAVASPTESGDPVVVGQMGGVALTDYNADTGEATVSFEGVYSLSVVAANDSGNSAVVLGDPIYIQADGTLNKDSSGIFFGNALGAIDSGETETIGVRLAQGGGGNGSALSAPAMSSEVTANGSAQNFAHGLGVAPSRVAVILTEFLSNQNVDVTEGTHTTTNAVVTVTTGVKYKVLAWK